MRKKAKKIKTVTNLENDDCRWPVGDPRDADFHFCGAQKVPGRPYCDMHWRMAFLPSRPRYKLNDQPPATSEVPVVAICRAA